jgi:hypothetical protein
LAIAQSGSGAPKKIKACAKKKGGALRLGKKCRKRERRVTWAVRGPTGLTGARGKAGIVGNDGAQGPPGTNGSNGASGTNGTSTGETFFDSADFGANFGGGGVCTAVPGGPSITVTVPSSSFLVQRVSRLRLDTSNRGARSAPQTRLPHSRSRSR